MSYDDIRTRLWNEKVTPDSYGGAEKYQAAVMDQWKLCVEMADRISARRGLTNTFFLTLNTAIFTVIGVIAKESSDFPDAWILLFPLIVVLGECTAWWWLVRSYRLLNGAKFMVVGLLEEQLPASPFWRAEWTALGEGKDWRKYLPLTHLEQWVPVLFALVYVIGFIAVATS